MSELVFIGDAAARWVSTSGFSPGAREARWWDLCFVARTLADSLGRPPAPSGGPAYLRDLGRLHWDDLEPSMVSVAIADFGAEHAPVTHRRVVATWSSFLRWLGKQGYPVPELEPAPLSAPETRTDLEPAEVGRLVAHAIRVEHRTRDAWPERDQAMVGVIVAASLSLANVSRLRLDDLEREDDRTRLRSRNRQGRIKVVELPPAVRNALEASWPPVRYARCPAPLPSFSCGLAAARRTRRTPCATSTLVGSDGPVWQFPEHHRRTRCGLSTRR